MTESFVIKIFFKELINGKNALIHFLLLLFPRPILNLNFEKDKLIQFRTLPS